MKNMFRPDKEVRMALVNNSFSTYATSIETVAWNEFRGSEKFKNHVGYVFKISVYE